MATEKAETDRIPVTLALSTITYLEKLVRQGTHGTSVPGVAKTLIEEGIRLAIKDGLLAIRDNGRPSRREHLEAAVQRNLEPLTCFSLDRPGPPNASNSSRLISMPASPAARSPTKS